MITDNSSPPKNNKSPTLRLLTANNPNVSTLLNDPQFNSLDIWKICTRAKDAFPQGERLENLTWRLMHLKLAKNKEDPTLDTKKETNRAIETPCAKFEPTSSHLEIKKSNSKAPRPFLIPESTPTTALNNSKTDWIEFSREPNYTTCSNCQTTVTPLWRKIENQTLCNACGLFFKLHGTDRPLSLKTNTIRKRNRLPKKSEDSGSEPKKISKSKPKDKAPVSPLEVLTSTETMNQLLMVNQKPYPQPILSAADSPMLAPYGYNDPTINVSQERAHLPRVHSVDSLYQSYAPYIMYGYPPMPFDVSTINPAQLLEPSWNSSPNNDESLNMDVYLN